MRDLILEITPQNCYNVVSDLGELTHDVRILDRTPERVKLVVFTGGEDVYPELYGEIANPKTYFSKTRDIYEISIFNKVRAAGIPCFGICRGSQFLCVMAGGKLVQHVDNHAGCTHPAMCHDGKIRTINSSHHQMQLPPKDARILAYASPSRSERHLDGENREIAVEKECEAVYYPGINALGTQWHSESLPSKHEGRLYAQQLIREFLLKE